MLSLLLIVVEKLIQIAMVREKILNENKENIYGVLRDKISKGLSKNWYCF
jgi:hypothetical protein